MTGGGPWLTVVICTRDRPERLAPTLAALRGQTHPEFDVIVVDQSRGAAPREPADEPPRVRVVPDPGVGASRARNLGWRAATTDWVAFFDDDCAPAADWVERLAGVVEANPDATCVSGRMVEDGATVFAVPARRRLEGRWVAPWRVGFGACLAVRQAMVGEIGGWDERLGPGDPDFPAAEDMDFIYRLMRAHAVAYLVPGLEVRHAERREPGSLPALHRTYARGFAGVATKQLRQGDVAGGLWLWALGLVDVAGNLAAALRHGSWSRVRVAAAKLRGLLSGTLKGVRRSW